MYTCICVCVFGASVVPWGETPLPQHTHHPGGHQAGSTRWQGHHWEAARQETFSYHLPTGSGHGKRDRWGMRVSDWVKWNQDSFICTFCFPTIKSDAWGVLQYLRSTILRKHLQIRSNKVSQVPLNSDVIELRCWQVFYKPTVSALEFEANLTSWSNCVIAHLWPCTYHLNLEAVTVLGLASNWPSGHAGSAQRMKPTGTKISFSTNKGPRSYKFNSIL